MLAVPITVLSYMTRAKAFKDLSCAFKEMSQSILPTKLFMHVNDTGLLAGIPARHVKRRVLMKKCVDLTHFHLDYAFLLLVLEHLRLKFSDLSQVFLNLSLNFLVIIPLKFFFLALFPDLVLHLQREIPILL